MIAPTGDTLTATIAVTSLVLFAYIYVREFASVVEHRRFQFRISDLAVLTTAIALMMAAGRVADTVAVCCAIFYTASVGRMWVSRGGLMAVVLGSLVAILTVTAVVVAAWAPLIAWRLGIFYLAIFTSACISFMFLIGDNATSELQLILVGLPFGLPINIAIGVLIGAALKWMIVVCRGEQAPKE